MKRWRQVSALSDWGMAVKVVTSSYLMKSVECHLWAYPSKQNDHRIEGVCPLYNGIFRPPIESFRSVPNPRADCAHRMIFSKHISFAGSCRANRCASWSAERSFLNAAYLLWRYIQNNAAGDVYSGTVNESMGDSPDCKRTVGVRRSFQQFSKDLYYNNQHGTRYRKTT